MQPSEFTASQVVESITVDLANTWQFKKERGNPEDFFFREKFLAKMIYDHMLAKYGNMSWQGLHYVY